MHLNQSTYQFHRNSLETPADKDIYDMLVSALEQGMQDGEIDVATVIEDHGLPYDHPAVEALLAYSMSLIHSSMDL